MRFIAFVLNGTNLSFSVLCFQNCIVLKINVLAFLRLSYIFLTGMKLFEPNRCFTLKTISDVCDGFISRG
jgi:hypothetical protein